MTHLLEIRERLIRFYQNHARIVNAVFRFLLSFLTFFSINQLIGYNPALNSWYVVLAFSVVNTVLPISVLLFLAAAYIVFHVYYVSVSLALVTLLVLLTAYLVYLRFLPEHGYVILAVPIMYGLRLPYLVPILLGLIGAPVAVIPMSCGVICCYALKCITTVVGTATEDSMVLFNQTFQMIFTNQEMYLTIAVFAIVMVVVNMICSQEFHYVYETAIVVGVIVNILLFLAVSFPFNIEVHVLPLMIETVICGVLAWIVQFFRLVLNYTAVEYLQFEDDEYYYYVKAVPKMNIAVGEKRVKRFNAHLLGGGRFGGSAGKDEPEPPAKEMSRPKDSAEQEI